MHRYASKLVFEGPPRPSVKATSVRGPRPSIPVGSKSSLDRKRMLAILSVAILLTIAVLRPTIGDEIEVDEDESADYGIFGTIKEMHSEQITRENDPTVVDEVQSALQSIQPVERSFEDQVNGGLTEETLDIPEPLEKSPVIFDAIKENPIVNNTSILDWILPPPASSQGALNYVILVKSGDRTVWSLGSIIPRLGMFTDSGVDKWLYIDVDGDPGTGDESGNDIRARMTFAKDLLARDWEVTLIPPSLKFNNAGFKIEIEATDPVNGMAGVGGSIYFIKGISYEGKNYIWSGGFGLDDFTESLRIMINARQWRAEPEIGLIRTLLQGGVINLGDLNILEIAGPYTISYEFETPPDHMDIFISVMRLVDQNLQDRAYVKIRMASDQVHNRIISKGRIVVGVENMDSPINSIEWKAGENFLPSDSQSISFRYTEFSDDLIDAHVSIPSLPGYLKIELDYTKDPSGRNLTIFDLTAPDGIPELHFLEVIYPSWSDTGNVDTWNATMVQLFGIPEKIHLETTASIPLTVEDDTGLNLNVLDTFMTQLAGRFYRLGEIFREIPRSVSEMPSRRGSTVLDCKGDSILKVRYISTSGRYLNGTDDLVAFFDSGDHLPSIYASIRGVSYYKGSFTENGNDITLRLTSTNRLKIYSISGRESAILTIEGIPGQIRIRTVDDRIYYEGTDNGMPDNIERIGYRFRDGELLFDVNIVDIPSSLTMIRSDDQVEVISGNGAIGSIEVFTSNSTTSGPLDMPERNFASVQAGIDGASVGLRLNQFRSFVYNNASNGFIEIETLEEANFYALIKDEVSGLDVVAAFVPLPSFTHIDLPSVLDTPEISIPDILDVSSITDYGDLLFSLENIGRAPLSVATSISQGLISAIGRVSTGLSLSWDLAEEGSTLDLIVTLNKAGKMEVPEAKWTHGIWMEQEGLGENSSVNGKIFLKGMPTRGEVNLSFSDKKIQATLDFEDYSPIYDWLLVRTTGVQDRDISIYIKGLSDGIDLFLGMMIYTDLSIGGRMTINMNVDVSDRNGEPIQLGSAIASLIKSQPILSVRQMYLPIVPSSMNLHADIENGMRADYSASTNIEYLYFKITKFINERWSQIYAIFHDLPLSFYANMTPNNEFSIQAPFITQGLPSMEIKTPDSGMDIFVEYDGSGFGQRGKFQIYADNLESTRTYYEDGDYVIDSEGIGFLSLQVDRLPVMEQFTLSSLSILGMNVEHLRISSEMTFGIYPQIFLEDTRGESFQIKVGGEINYEGNIYSPDLFFITFKTTDIAGVGVPTRLSINKDTSAVNMERSDGAIILPAPIITGWYMLLEPVFGGD